MKKNNDSLGMLEFKLSVCIRLAWSLLQYSANYINELWTDFDENLPEFVEKFTVYWSPADYADFCNHVEKWADKHNEVYEEELWCRIRALIMRDKQAYLFGVAREFARKKSSELLCKSENIQQLCDELGEENDIIYVDITFFKQCKGFGKLRELSAAMDQHAYFLLNYRLDFHAILKTKASEQATAILKEEGDN